MFAAKLAGLIGVLKRRLHVLVVVTGTYDGQGCVERDAPPLHRNQQAFLAVFEERQDAIYVFDREACLLRDHFFVITLITQLLDAGK